MEFNDFKKEFQKHFTSMIKDKDKLFLTDADKDTMWEKYLDSFPEGTNNLYKEKREYDCNSCKSFIRHYGNVVTIKSGKLVSIWDIKDLETPFKEVAKVLSDYVKSSNIKEVFITKIAKLGTDKNKQLVDDKVLTWEHLYFELPKHYVSTRSDSIEASQAFFRDSKNVFQRSMEELTLDSGKIVLELIEQGSLYRGEEHKQNIETFISYKKKFDKLSEKEKDIWCWQNSFDNPIARIRNTALGTLLIDLSADMEVDQAVTKFEKVMAPTNYKRPKAIFTKKMVEDAEKKLAELGMTNSLGRRFAQLEDITVNNVLFVNRDVKNKLKGTSPFDSLKEEVSVVNPKKFDKVEEVGIEEFMKNILPKTTSIELMIENRHSGNLMSLIAPKDKEAPTMFKWNNNFSWAYNGDIADSMKQRVKEAGGNIEGVLRFSIQWNDGEYNPNDFDAHCIEPDNGRSRGEHIYYANPRNLSTTCQLDVDIRNPVRGKIAVENITWINKSKMREGKYEFYVHNFAHRGGKTGFSAEIEYEGQVWSFDYSKELRQSEKVIVAEIEFSKKDGIKFIKSLESSTSSRNVWGIETNKFSKVNVCMFSPNYWDDQDKIGNKHYFFFMENCKNETSPRGFFNEFLDEKLTPHRKVFEALGSHMRVEESDNQLSGIGFSSTQRNSILAKIDGSISRVIKLVF